MRIAWLLWDHDLWLTFAVRAVQRARDTGALSLLTLSLGQLAGATVLTGDLAAAEALMEEGEVDHDRDREPAGLVGRALPRRPA